MVPRDIPLTMVTATGGVSCLIQVEQPSTIDHGIAISRILAALRFSGTRCVLYPAIRNVGTFPHVLSPVVRSTQLGSLVVGAGP